MKQLRGTEIKRHHRKFKKPQVEIVVIVQNVEDPRNIGSIFRVADACRINMLYLCGVTPSPPNVKISRASRGKERNVPWEYHKQAEKIIPELKEKGFAIYAVEITNNAELCHRVQFPDKVCLIVGNEEYGITKKLLALCDKSTAIPMFGKGRSLNVHVSLAVACYQIIFRHLSVS